MQLTQNQIQDLYPFTRKHFVEWYDLQTELVDHLTNDIEHIWQQEPNLPFQQARDKAFKKFGIFGFGDIIQKKQHQLDKKYWKLCWKYFKEYFKIPKIILTALLIAVTYSLLHFFENKQVFLFTIIGISCVLLMIDLYHKSKQTKKRQKETGKKWMFENQISTLGGFSIIAQLPLNTINFTHNVNWTVNTQIIAASTLVFYIIICYIVSQIIPKKLEEEAAKLYPEYNLS